MTQTPDPTAASSTHSSDRHAETSARFRRAPIFLVWFAALTATVLAAELFLAPGLLVARDLHDGIGQKLTALKFSLESLSPSKPKQAAERINQLKILSKEIILGVRLATFNLTPPELIDYGLGPALEKMARELSRLTGEHIVFRNDAVDYRLTGPAEINLYRTVQEAVNNAIKYARANYILITLSAGPQLLSITIDDDGEGFDREDLYNKTDGSGLGLHFMEERIGNLNGRIFMRSHPETGTRISINVPLSECEPKEG